MHLRSQRVRRDVGVGRVADCARLERACTGETRTVAVDVLTEIEIARPRAEVAAYASAPENATEWYANIKRARRESPTRVAFEARFLGRTLRYTYEIVEDTPGERYVMRNDSMETTYTWSDTPSGTRMTLRNRGSAPRLTAPFVRRATRKDLARLKEILETGH